MNAMTYKYFSVCTTCNMYAEIICFSGPYSKTSQECGNPTCDGTAIVYEADTLNGKIAHHEHMATMYRNMKKGVA